MNLMSKKCLKLCKKPTVPLSKYQKDIDHKRLNIVLFSLYKISITDKCKRQEVDEWVLAVGRMGIGAR